jgi:hypothetical protein
MADKQFEQQMQDRMEEFKLTPSAPVWNNIEAQLRKDKRRRWLFFLLFAGLITGTGAAIYQYSHTSAKQPVAVLSSGNEKKSVKPATEQSLSSHSSTIAQQPVTVNHSGLSSSSPSSNNTTTLQVKRGGQTKKRLTVPKPNPVFIVASSEKEKKILAVETKNAAQQKNDTAVSQQNNNVSTKALASTDTSTSETHMTEIPVTETSENKNSVTERVVDTPVTAKSQTDTVITKKRTTQKGWSINTGISSVRESLFPATAFTTSDFAAIPVTGSGSPGGFNGFIISEFSIRGKWQAGAGYALRFPVLKRSWMVTGIQYQFSSFSVVSRTRRDTFSQPQNRLVSDYSNEQKGSYNFHYLNIPTELQWYIAGTSANSVQLSTGIHHQFLLAVSKGLPAFTSRTGDKAAGYQALLHVAPSYEWASKKGVMQLGWYVNYSLSPVYRNTSGYNWWQTGLRFQYWFNKK